MWSSGLDFCHNLVGLQHNEEVTVQLQRVRAALALEEARKVAPLG